MKKTLGDCIIITITLPAHALDKAMVFKHSTEEPLGTGSDLA